MAKRFVSNLGKWSAAKEKEFDIAVLEMATDIHRESSILAPKKNRHLVNSGRIVRVKAAHYQVWYGNASVPYARIQHQGGTIKPKRAKMLAWQDDNGSWVFAHSVTLKGKKYLSVPGDTIARRIKRYVR